jgi:Flp pilus assembly protein TadG
MSPAKPATSSSRTDRGQRGSASIELVILLPALFAVMFLGMQAALFYHARAIAIAAAQEGARAAGGQNASTSDGISAATAFLSDAGGADVLRGASAEVDRTATTVTVTIRGSSLSVIPGWSPLVVQHASVTVERLTTP